MTLATIILLIAFILFTLGAFGATRPNINLVAAGLACLTLYLILGTGVLG